MLFSTHASIEDLIVQELGATQPLSVHELVVRIRAQHKPAISERAVYKAVRILAHSCVVVKIGAKFTLDKDWLEKVQAELLLKPPIVELGRGESVSYQFRSLAHVDALWITLMDHLETRDRAQPMFFYNPHNLWVHLPERKESERGFYAQFQTKVRYGFFAIGGSSPLDISFKRAYQHEYLQIDVHNRNVFPRTDHVTILGEYIVTVRLSKSLAQAVDMLYRSESNATKLERKLAKHKIAVKNMRLRIVRNPQKARALRKKLSGNFAVPKALVEQFSLY